MTQTEKIYSTKLKFRIINLMDEANFLPTGENDWKAIYRNIERYHPESVTDEEILSEIEIFYTA